MKIALACQSVLLEKSLEMFLKKYITPYKQCDFVISDRKIEIEKPLFYLSTDDSDLNIPFSSSTLLLEVEKFYNSLVGEDVKAIKKEVNIEDLEKKITKLTNDFRENLIDVIKDYYEK